MYQFNKNLALGHQYEDIWIKNYLQAKPEDVERCNNGAYDIVHSGIAYEVKCDRTSFQWDSFLIQFSWYGRPAGIVTTMADFYVIFVIYPKKPYRLYKIPVCVIKEAVRDKSWTHTICPRNDGGSKCYIFPHHLFSDYEIDVIGSSATMEC